MRPIIRSHTHRQLSLVMLAGAVALAASAPTAALEWSLYGRHCAVQGGEFVVTCGEYGVFHFDGAPSSSCDPLATGDEDPPVYSGPGAMTAFPGSVVMLDDLIQQIERSRDGAGAARAAALPQSGGISSPPEPDDPALDVVIDFTGPHGASTTWLVDAISGPGADAAMLALDDPALEPLGEEVGDFHVLASLCRVLDDILYQRIPPPRTINMSFGRSVATGDADPPDDCVDGRASCQIARVAAALRGRGVRLVAAAGNHGEMLFPAALEHVIAAGMLELNGYLDRGAPEPAWQTPDGADVLTPGNALCLRFWPAPAGSSYSSALFSGWLSTLLVVKPGLDPLAGGPWWPAWNEALSCHVLTNGVESVAGCNGRVDAAFDGLAGANAATCWFADETPSQAGERPGEPGPPPSLPSLAAWSAETSPTPEADPCVPCVARFATLSPADVRIDMSQSKALPPGMVLDDVRLQIGTSNYPLGLDPTVLDAIEDGELSELLLPGWGPLLTPAGPVSLWYRLKPDEGTDCSVPGSCFWSSTPVLLGSS